MMHSPKTTPRSEYLLLEKQRVQSASTLAETFPELKSLTVDLGYYDPEGLHRGSQIKYTVNMQFEKSVFRIACHNHECVRGDFDLSSALANAVTARLDTVSSEMCCQGWRSRPTIDTVPCHNILRYKLTLEY